MKRIVLILLVLCVSLGTMARSQVIISGQQARQLIAKLDTLDHLRTGYAMLDTAYQLQEQMLYQRDTVLFYKDSIIAKQDSLVKTFRKRELALEKDKTFWKRISCGLGISTLTAILIGAFK